MDTRHDCAPGAVPQTASRPLTAEELFAKATAASAPMWDHACPIEGAGFFVGVGEPCAWCGAEQRA